MSWQGEEAYEYEETGDYVYGVGEWSPVEPPYPAFAGKGGHPTGFNPQGQQMTTKIPPSYDGSKSWFAFEELIDDWCDVTEIDPAKRGPALRNALQGDASVYKNLLDREKLLDPIYGVEYFKKEMRPHFVKGNQSVFLWRFFQVFKFHRRGAQSSTLSVVNWVVNWYLTEYLTGI